MKILVAEDDADQLSLRCMLLAHSGFETLAAGDAATALALAAEHQPRCAVLDLNLPTSGHGLHLAKQLKQLDPAMHVILLTGGGGRQLAQASASTLVDDVIIKASSFRALIEKLKQIAANTPGADQGFEGEAGDAGDPAARRARSTSSVI